jgi:chromosome segregation ATPase
MEFATSRKELQHWEKMLNEVNDEISTLFKQKEKINEQIATQENQAASKEYFSNHAYKFYTSEVQQIPSRREKAKKKVQDKIDELQLKIQKLEEELEAIDTRYDKMEEENREKAEDVKREITTPTGAIYNRLKATLVTLDAKYETLAARQQTYLRERAEADRRYTDRLREAAIRREEEELRAAKEVEQQALALYEEKQRKEREAEAQRARERCDEANRLAQAAQAAPTPLEPVVQKKKAAKPKSKPKPVEIKEAEDLQEPIPWEKREYTLDELDDIELKYDTSWGVNVQSFASQYAKAKYKKMVQKNELSASWYKDWLAGEIEGDIPPP